MIARRLARPLVYLGIIGVVLAMSKVHAAWVADPPYDYTGSSRFAWSIGYMLLLALLAYGVGLPDLPRTTRSAVGAAAAGAVGAAVAISLIQLVTGDALLPRFVVGGSALLLVPWYMLCVAVAAGGRAAAEAHDRVVLVGDKSEAEVLRFELAGEPERPAVLVEETVSSDGHPGGSVSPIADLVMRERATVVVLDREALGRDDVVAEVALLHEAGIRIRTLSLFYEEWLGKLPIGELERVSLLFDIGEVHRARYGRLKRILDLLMALVGLVILVLLVPFIVVGDLVANRGPLLYRQPRVGKNGELFDIVKFRTMRPVADGAMVTEWTSENDPRISRFGRFMRTTHIDELPQMVNVMRGELSVVGPRPEQPQYVDELSTTLPFYHLRHLVRPGITGWAQVKYGYAGNEGDTLEKLQYEFYYLRRQDLGFDLRIIGRTIRSMIGRGGR